MSSIDNRAVVDFVQSLGSPSSSGTISANTVPDKVSRRELLARINIEEATLLAEGRPWYEIKASLLQESDKSFIKDLSGMSDQYDILIPLPEDRAHLPPEGYHTFYINQLEMGLRFPIPRFIQSLCDHLCALSVIPRGSWGDVARRFTMIRWALSVIPRGSWGDVARRFTMIRWPPSPPLHLSRRRRRPCAAVRRRKTVSGQFDVENPIVLISSGLLVQSDEGASSLVVDRIDESTAINREAPGS
ncbi:hypothetical protein F511_38684 [Dorcoceras hygrometricum]|uniref:Uncharacterized protein n=1 Tax=Dorcoceras hygrometricum TaxID=472368 RepID=A0A2Z7B463_9LAMI|nr:hypothetical protein F511_38684 [Dorcoceras hygrometricum]